MMQKNQGDSMGKALHRQSACRPLQQRRGDAGGYTKFILTHRECLPGKLRAQCVHGGPQHNCRTAGLGKQYFSSGLLPGEATSPHTLIVKAARQWLPFWA